MSSESALRRERFANLASCGLGTMNSSTFGLPLKVLQQKEQERLKNEKSRFIAAL